MISVLCNSHCLPYFLFPSDVGINIYKTLVKAFCLVEFDVRGGFIYSSHSKTVTNNILEQVTVTVGKTKKKKDVRGARMTSQIKLYSLPF